MPLLSRTVALLTLSLLAFEQQALAQEQTTVTLGSLERRPLDDEELVLTTTVGAPPRLAIQKPNQPQSATLQSLPIASTLLNKAIVHAFGMDERCMVEKKENSLRVKCRPGETVSGATVQFRGYRMPQRGAIVLSMKTTSDASFTTALTALGADALSASRITNNMTLPLPMLPLATEPQLVILAPTEGGTINVSNMKLSPNRKATRPTESAAWAWSPEAWRTSPGALIKSAKAKKLNKLYITLNIKDGAVQDTDVLRRFIKKAAASNINIGAVEGDPQMVLPDGLAAARKRARAFAVYQRTSVKSERLSGIQYDIEPYILPQWGDYPANADGWAEAIAALSTDAGEAIDLVLPFWILGDERTAAFMSRVGPSVRGITVMAYRTDPAILSQIAEPLLAWGAEAGVDVRVALEAGLLPDETVEVFARAAIGTIAVRPGDAPQVLLLESPGEVTNAQMYTRISRSIVPGSALSFQGDDKTMFAFAGQTHHIFAAWPSFAGFAFHGLDWPINAR